MDDLEFPRPYVKDTTGEQIFRVEIPVIFDVKTKTEKEAVEQVIEQVVNLGLGLGAGTVRVNYKEYIEDQLA